jgi:hypothetical protein
MKKYFLILATIMSSPAYADMSHSEFAARNRSGDWLSPSNYQFSENYNVGVVGVSPNKKVVADMVAREVSSRIGQDWVQTALKLTKLESGFNCGAVGPKTRHGRAQGLLQVMPGTARAMGYNPSRLRECQYGLAAGVEHMKRCLDSGVRTHAQMSSCHVSGFHGWKVRLNARSERYRQKYIRLARR